MRKRFWCQTYLRSILKNEMYVGCMVQGRQYTPSYRSKKREPVPKEDWIVVPDMHEPIVTRELFDEAQKKMQARKKVIKPLDEPRLFSGLFYCEACGTAMRQHTTGNGKYTYFICGKHHAIGKAEAVKRCREKQQAAQPPKPQQRTLKELAECAEAGLPLTPEEVERLEAHRNRKKAALQDLKARAETDPAAAAELAQQRAQQSEAVKKSRQKMYADAAAGDPEAQARYERFLATKRENYHRKKQTEAEAAQAT